MIIQEEEEDLRVENQRSLLSRLFNSVWPHQRASTSDRPSPGTECFHWMQQIWLFYTAADLLYQQIEDLNRRTEAAMRKSTGIRKGHSSLYSSLHLSGPSMAELATIKWARVVQPKAQLQLC